MVKSHRKHLPKNWRQQVVEMLAAQGLTANENKVYDALRGRVNDEVLVATIKKNITHLRRQHKQKKKRLEALLAT